MEREKQGDTKPADTEEHKRRASKNIQRMNAAPKKPHLPKEDIKVLIRPKDGFNTAGYSVAQIGDCMLRATGLKPEEVVKDHIRINERQNIVVATEGQFRTKSPGQVDLQEWNYMMQRTEGETGSGHHGSLNVNWADAVYCRRAKVKADPCNANAKTKS
ncbi:hypothetical protein HPB50_003989 [Hyalomma asiaticum]|uniref:Uncharacterized protein n=1 Tax=Hyalomma asiaticum TaxID=266040 RepID=A0ACB7TBX1_HYAAI|nr:hypothetical protein HPB50_003989 [Hyalomma asiaticum]